MKISIKLLLGTVIIVIILIFASVFYFSRQSEIVLESDRISISGIYGEDIYYKDIVNIELDSKEPKIIKKIKGLDFRNTYKGEFKIEEVGKATLFVHSKNSYIYIYLDKEIYIINLSNINETEQLYRLIKTRM